MPRGGTACPPRHPRQLEGGRPGLLRGFRDVGTTPAVPRTRNTDTHLSTRRSRLTVPPALGAGEGVGRDEGGHEGRALT